MKHWGKVKLGDLCEVITKGTTPTSIGFKFTDSGISFIKVESLTESGEIVPNKVAYIDENCHQALKRSQLKKDDILFSIAGALGRIGIVKEDILPANTNQALAIIRLKKDSNALIEFIAKYFKSNIVTDEIEKLRIGAAQQNLSLTQLNNLFVPLPPLPEQQRIVSILDKAFAAIARAKANADQNLKNAKELFESYLNNLIIDDGKWKVEKLGSVCDIKGRIGYRGYTVQDLVQKGEGAISLSPSNIQDNKFITAKCTYISWFKYEESPEIKVFEGDILFVKTGSTYGKVALVENLPEKATINPQFVVLKDLKCLNRFLYYALTTRAFKEKVESIVGGAATPTLSQTNLAEQTIPQPPLEQQQTIVHQLDSLRAETQKLQAMYKKKIDDLEELKKSILAKAFAGELRCGEPVEPKTEKELIK
jgi:type I restriction enzyme S subunit